MADGGKFSTPKRRLAFEKHSFSDEKRRYAKHIKEHFFNHSVSLIVPECAKDRVLQGIPQSSSPSVFARVDLPAHVFIDEEFIDNFIRKGCFYALSKNTHIDTDNCIVVLPTGVLLLSLIKDSYEELGLPGKKSIFQKNIRFIVEIDLKSSSFRSGGKLYERVRWSLKDRLDLNYTYLLSWTTQDGTDGNNKLLSYLEKYQCEQVSNTLKFSQELNVRAPVIDPAQVHIQTDKGPTGCDAPAFYEWLGCFECGIDCSLGYPDSYSSTLSCPTPSQKLYSVAQCKWTGFITPEFIHSILGSARSLYKRCPEIPWMAFTVWGFADAPVSWQNNEHGFELAGDNTYTFVLFQSEQYWLYKAMGSHDVCS